MNPTSQLSRELDLQEALEPRTAREISLIDLAVAPARNARLILKFCLWGALLSVLFALLSPNIYTGVTKILPPQQNQSAASALLAQMGSLGALVGQGYGMRSANDIYLAMLTSDSVGREIDRRFDLKTLYERKTLTDALISLQKNTRITSGKEGIITIEVDDKDAVRAADLANAYVDALVRLSQTLAVTEAGQRRIFFERQLTKARSDLSAAEAKMRSVQERTGLIQPEMQGRAIVETIAAIRARISAKQVELQVLRSAATDNNPDVVRVQQELSGLRTELQKLERSSPSEGDIMVSTRSLPGVGVDYFNALRDVKYNETLFELLAKQYELARIDEAKQGSVVQQMDRAQVPEKKTRPNRALTVIVLTMMSGLFGVVWSWGKLLGEGLWSSPQNREKVDIIRNSVRELVPRSWRRRFARD